MQNEHQGGSNERLDDGQFDNNKRPQQAQEVVCRGQHDKDVQRIRSVTNKAGAVVADCFQFYLSLSTFTHLLFVALS